MSRLPALLRRVGLWLWAVLTWRWAVARKVLIQNDQDDPVQSFATNSRLENDDASVVIEAAATEATIAAFGDSSATITVKADGTIVLAATDGDVTITLDPDGTVEIDAPGLVTVSPGNTFDEDGNATLAGGVVTLGADGAVSFSGRIVMAAAGDIDLGSGSVLIPNGGPVTIATDLIVAGSSITVGAFVFPSTDPEVAGKLYTDGAPAAGTPQALMVSGGPP